MDKFIRFKMNVYKIDSVDYMVLKDSSLKEDFEGFQYSLILKNGVRDIIVFPEEYPIEVMKEDLSEYDMVTIEDDAGDIISINTNNIEYIDRNIEGLLRIHFINNILVLLVKDDKKVVSILSKLTDWS